MIKPFSGKDLTLLLIGLSVTNPFAFHIFLPSLPGLSQSMGASPAFAQLTVSIYVATFAFMQLCYGPLSDRFGRRRVILTGLAIYVLAPLYCAQADTIEALVIGRSLQAMGGCAGLMFARVIARDLFERSKAASVIGFVTMMTSLVTAAIPAIGGYLDVWLGWQASFWLTSVYGAIVLVCCYLWLPETRPDHPARGILQTFVDGATLVTSPVFVGHALHGACTLSCWYAMLTGLPYVLVEVLDQPATAYGFYYPVLAIGYMLGNLITARTASSLGVERLINIGIVFALVPAVFVVVWCVYGNPTPLALFLPFGLIVLGHGMSQPASFSIAVGVRSELAGSAAGIMGFAQWIIAAATTQALGLVLSDSVWPVVWFVVGFSVLSAFSSFVGFRGEKNAAVPHSAQTTKTENNLP